MGKIGKLAGGAAVVIAIGAGSLMSAPTAAAAYGPFIDNGAIDAFFMPESVSIGPTTGLDGKPAYEFSANWDVPDTEGFLTVSQLDDNNAPHAPEKVMGGVDANPLLVRTDNVEIGAAIPAATNGRPGVVITIMDVEPTDKFVFSLTVDGRTENIVATQPAIGQLRTQTVF